MIPFCFDYATPSAFHSDRDQALLGLSADRRRPVRFHGRIRDNAFLLRVALRAFGEALWSQESWSTGGATLDPIVTVSSDRLLFEAFSQDQSSFVQLSIDTSLFEIEGPIEPGTANLDFSAWLWAALAEIRTFRETRLRIGGEGVEVKTAGAGGRFERRVRLPLEWVRGFMQLQMAMALPGTRLEVRPVDLLAAIRYLRYTKARVSPRALRYEFPPGKPPELVLEPWEHRIPFKGAEHGFLEPRVIRLWGRRRLRLIEPLLPFADRVGIYLKGRARPSFYAVRLPGMTFTLGLTGWSEAQWSIPLSATVRIADGSRTDADLRSEALALLRRGAGHSSDALARHLQLTPAQVEGVMQSLCRQGKITYDLERREFRFRELFPDPIDEAEVFPPSPQFERARELLDSGRVEVLRATIQETRKSRSLSTPEGRVAREIVYRDWHVVGRIAGTHTTEIVVQDNVKVIFGKCTCDHFNEHLLNLGPCAEMLALLEASEPLRGDLPVSTGEAGIPPMKRPRPDGEDASDEDEHDSDDEEGAES